MEPGMWLDGSWREALQTAGISVSLIATVYSIYDNSRTRRVENLFHITREHREIWTEVYKRPDLKRVLDPIVDLSVEPLTAEEKLFISFLILHLSSVYRASREGLIIKLDGLAEDVRQFFARPIPAHVWELTKQYQQRDFVRFIEGCLK